jgi:hypothetical protein
MTADKFLKDLFIAAPDPGYPDYKAVFLFVKNIQIFSAAGLTFYTVPLHRLLPNPAYRGINIIGRREKDFRKARKARPDSRSVSQNPVGFGKCSFISGN